MLHPTISIITINLNDAKGLLRTIESVIHQTYKEFEFIIIDGASVDESLSVINTHESHIDTWISEPDSGLYAAMNKGIARAKGEYVSFMNSGDTFCNAQVLEQVFSNRPTADILLGRINIVKSNGAIQRDYALKQKDMTLFSLYLYGVPHQASFIRRSLFDECGYYDETLKINADWKFFVQALILHNKSLQHLNVTIADFDDLGISSRNKTGLLEERQQVFNELIPERIRKDYQPVLDHYYEVYRIEWLLKHKIAYKLYRLFVSIGMRLF